MKRFVALFLALLLIWVLAYALAFISRREHMLGGWTYTPWPVVEDVAYPAFWPLYRLHHLAGGPRHARDS